MINSSAQQIVLYHLPKRTLTTHLVDTILLLLIAQYCSLVFVYSFGEYFLEDALEDLIFDYSFVGVQRGPFWLAASPLGEQYIIDVI